MLLCSPVAVRLQGNDSASMSWQRNKHHWFPHSFLYIPPQSIRIKCLSLGMGLVEYSDSSTDSEPEEPLPPKKKQRTSNDAINQPLPALPNAFHDLYASSIRVSVRDDPNLHGGRKRVIPHVEGNWPTHIYLECETLANRFFDSCWFWTRVPSTRWADFTQMSPIKMWGWIE